MLDFRFLGESSSSDLSTLFPRDRLGSRRFDSSSLDLSLLLLLLFPRDRLLLVGSRFFSSSLSFSTDLLRSRRLFSLELLLCSSLLCIRGEGVPANDFDFSLEVDFLCFGSDDSLRLRLRVLEECLRSVDSLRLRLRCRRGDDADDDSEDDSVRLILLDFLVDRVSSLDR